MMIEVGKSFTLKVTGSKSGVKFASANKAIATVTAKGKVTAKKVGRTTITAKVGKQTLKCAVRVTYRRKTFTLRGKKFSMAIPPTWTYKYYNKKAVVFYDKYVYTHFKGEGFLFAVAANTDKELTKLTFVGTPMGFGKIGKYNFYVDYGAGNHMIGDKTADKHFINSLKQSYSIAVTFRPVARTVKQRAYNAYFQFLSNRNYANCPFALANITNDNIPELVVDMSRAALGNNGDYNTIVIYTYKGGRVRQLCKAGILPSRAGYYFKKNIVFGDSGLNAAMDVQYYIASKNKKLLRSMSILYSGRRVNTYYNASGKKIKKATFTAALNRYTGKQKPKRYAFYNNTLKNRKKLLNN